MSTQTASELNKQWQSDARWTGILRPYSGEDVARLRGSIHIEHTLARLGAERLWKLLHTRTLRRRPRRADRQPGGAAGARRDCKAIYLSGWQVAADANDAGQMYPDQSLYPADSVPDRGAQDQQLAAARRPDPSHGRQRLDVLVRAHRGRRRSRLWRHAECLRTDEGHDRSGRRRVHFEDQLSSAKKCGHLGGKVLVPTSEAIQKLIAARLAADVLGVPTLLMARTDADSAHLLTSDIDPRDREFLTGERTAEGFFRIRGGIDAAIARGLAYAPYADLIWCETSEPNLEEARRFADAIHAKFPGKLLAYNCSPSFHWKKKLDDATIADLPARSWPAWATSSSSSPWPASTRST